jgi:hypothetical protein
MTTRIGLTFLGWVILVTSFSIGLTPLTESLAEAQVDGTYELQIKRKSDAKKSHRWTLLDWLSWKEQQKAMDMWLAKNSHHSPFEFFLESSALNYDRGNGDPTPTRSNTNHYGGALAAYAGVAGLRSSYYSSQENQTTWSASFNLRLLGRAIQDTHLNLEYGLRGLAINRDAKPIENFQNQFGGGTLGVYFTKHFGVEGTYQRVFANSERNRTLEGEVSKGSLFIDFGPLRIFGEWSKEMRQYLENSLTTHEYREGLGGGIRLFF